MVPVLVAATATLIGVAPAEAADRHPPNVTLRADAGTQRGHGYAFTWSYPDGEFCTGHADDGPFRPRSAPGALPVGADRRDLTITIAKQERPARVELDAYEAVDDTGTAMGPSTELSTTMRRIRTDAGRTRWRITLDVEVTDDRYLDLFVVWHERGRCLGRQDAAWSFHISP